MKKSILKKGLPSESITVVNPEHEQSRELEKIGCACVLEAARFSKNHPANCQCIPCDCFKALHRVAAMTGNRMSTQMMLEGKI